MALSKITNASVADTAVHGRRNLLINGGMQVAQRSGSETGLGSGDGYKTIDRYQAQFNTAARFTFSQETSDVPNGFSSAFKIATTTADTTVASDEYVVVQQPIEAQDLQHLKVGSSDAESLTFSFYAKANASATYMVELQTLDGTGKNAQHQFTVTDSWQRFSVTFNGNTAGTINNDTGVGLEVKYWLHAGSDFSSGTYTAGEFSSNTSADRAVGIDSIADSTSRTLLFTGWQLEVGDKSTPFEHRSFGEELAACRRYYCQSGAYGVADNPWKAGVTTNASYNYMMSDQMNSTADRHPVNWMWPTPMRTSPTMTYYPARTAIANTAARINPYNSNTLVTFTSSPAARPEVVLGYFSGTSTDSNSMTFNYTADAEL